MQLVVRILSDYIYNVCIESSRKEFPLEQYNYVVTVWCIFSCDNMLLIAPKMKK